MDHEHVKRAYVGMQEEAQPNARRARTEIGGGEPSDVDDPATAREPSDGGPRCGI